MHLPNDSDDTKRIDILDPLHPEMPDGSVGILALIANYTERPDLLLEMVEKHDPGFIKRMNQNAEEGAAEFRKSRFNFGRFQAYTTLAVQVLVAGGILLLMYNALVLQQLSFGVIIAFAVFYAVAQGGTHGFLEVVKGVKDFLRGKGKDEQK